MSDHDNEREAFEAFTAKRYGANRIGKDNDGEYSYDAVREDWELWQQARAAAVKPVQDDSGPQSQWSDAKKNRIAEEQEQRSITDLIRAQYKAIGEVNIPKRKSRSIADILTPVAYTGNTEARELVESSRNNGNVSQRKIRFTIHKAGTFDVDFSTDPPNIKTVDNPAQSPSSPLSESEAVEIMEDALDIYFDENPSFNATDAAVAAYRALKEAENGK